MVLLEAKSHSLPIVAFDIMTGPREMVQDGVDGFLVEDGNVEEMAQRIIQLIEDPKLREEFSKNSTKILELYAKDRILKQWYKLLNSLIFYVLNAPSIIKPDFKCNVATSLGNKWFNITSIDFACLWI